MRFLLRLFGYGLIAAGFVALVIDGARSIANAALLFTPVSDVVALAFRGDGLARLQASTVRLHPLLWDPIMTGLMKAPVELVAFVAGFLLLQLGQPKRPLIGIVTRR